MKTHALLLPVLLALSGCAQSFADLAPFPCPETGECPSGLYCTARKECDVLPPNTACTRAEDCYSRYPSAGNVVCASGVCAVTCSDGECPDGRACVSATVRNSSGYSYDTDVCLQECDEETACPSNTRCQTTYDGPDVCSRS